MNTIKLGIQASINAGGIEDSTLAIMNYMDTVPAVFLLSDLKKQFERCAVNRQRIR